MQAKKPPDGALPCRQCEPVNESDRLDIPTMRRNSEEKTLPSSHWHGNAPKMLPLAMDRKERAAQPWPLKPNFDRFKF